jgi:acetolactate synthase-1/2/3 large subunit
MALNSSPATRIPSVSVNYAPGVLWTAVHHKIPMLTVIYNNRGYHQEVMFATTMAARANRDVSHS